MLASPTDLAYFLEVANTLNISRAAERAGISQPSLTLAMQRLEEAIGTSLLIRNKSGVTLTQAGKQLLIHTKHLLHSWEQIKVQALASAQEIKGAYTIGCHPSVALFSLAKALPIIMNKYKELEIKLIHTLSRKVTEGVISSEIDLGIVVNPVQHPDLVIKKICSDEVTFWSSNHENDVQKVLSNSAILLCDPELLQVQAVLKNANKKGIKFRRIITSSSLELIAKLTANGCGIGILPARVAKSATNNSLIKLQNFPVFKDEICLLYRVENKNNKALKEISKEIILQQSE